MKWFRTMLSSGGLARPASGLVLLVILIATCFSTANVSEAATDGLVKAPFMMVASLPSGRVQFASPALGDVDGDGKLEIVVGTLDGWVHVIKPDRYEGTILWSRDTSVALNAFARNATKTTIRNAITIADLDGDGYNEVIVPVGDVFETAENGGMVVYTHDGRLKEGWPQLTYDRRALGHTAGIVSTPAVADINADGKLEIIAGAFDHRVYAWHHDGRLVEGWPRHVFDTVWSSPAVGDIDNDGLLEIVIGVDAHVDPYQGSIDGGALYVFKPDGSTMLGFPRYINEIISSTPALADLTGNGYLDIVVGAGRYYNGSDGSKVHAYDYRGRPLSGWPVTTGGAVLASPAVVDLDANGTLEVVVGSSDGKVYAWRHTGTLVPGWPMTPRNWVGNALPQRTAIVADVDGAERSDGRLEVLISHGWEVTIIDSGGRQQTWDGLSDNPLLRPSYLTDYTLDAPPAVGDITGDGRLELVAAGASRGGTQAVVYVWTLPASSTRQVAHDWPMYKRNTVRSSVMDGMPNNDATVVRHNVPEVLVPGQCVDVSVTMRNTGYGHWQTDASYRLGALFDSSQVFAMPSRLAVPQRVAAGEEVTYDFEICAPQQVGYYPLDLRMVQDGVAWFGARISRRIRVGTAPAFQILYSNVGGQAGVLAGGMAREISPPNYQSMHNTRALALTPDGAGYYLLDGVGGNVVWTGTAADIGSVGTKPAVDIELTPDGQGFYVIDVYGRLSRTSGALVVSPAPPIFGDPRVVSFAVVPGSNIGVLVLAKDGSVYAGGGARLSGTSTPTFAQPLAKKIQASADGRGYYVLDAYGRVHAGGGASPIAPNYSLHLNEDWARDFELTEDGAGYYLLDRLGQVHTGGTATANSVQNPKAAVMGEALDLELHHSGLRAAVFNVGIGANSTWMVAYDEVSALPSRTFWLENVGVGGSLSWSARVVEGASWLQVTPEQGQTPQQATLSVTRVPGLGRHTAVVEFSAFDAAATFDGTVTLRIELLVVEQVMQSYIPLVNR